MSVFGVILVRSFLHSDSIRIDTTITPNTDTFYAVLVSHNVIGFEYFIAMSQVINNKGSPIVFLTPTLYQVFIRFVCCFKYVFNFFLLSDQVIAKNNVISSFL